RYRVPHRPYEGQQRDQVQHGPWRDGPFLIAPTRGSNGSTGRSTTTGTRSSSPLRGAATPQSHLPASLAPQVPHRPYEGQQRAARALPAQAQGFLIAPTRGSNSFHVLVPKYFPTRSSSPLRGAATSPRAGAHRRA